MIFEAKTIYIVGIKGSAMSNLAVIFSQMGKQVSGCDVEEEFITDPILRQYKIPFAAGFDGARLPDVDLVIYSAAHGGAGNPVVAEAARRGIRTLSQAQVLGELVSHFRTSIAVSGCHGKTTTTSLLSYALKRLGVNPSYLIGAPFFNETPGGFYGGAPDYLAIEADEYGVNPPHDKTPKLLFLHPTHIICTNIDFDHPDVYENLEATKTAFLEFFSKGRLFLCTDDPNLHDVMKKLDRSRYLTYGFGGGSDLLLSHPVFKQDESSFDAAYKGASIGTFTLSLFGEKNLLNAGSVVLALLDLGFKPDAVREAIKGFKSVKRRFELVHVQGDTHLYDDYGHHPSEIASTIAAARSRFPGRRIGILFQPHTYSRTSMLKEQFAQALAKGDYCIVAPIFASARENSESFSISSFDIEKEAVNRGFDNVKAAGSREDAIRFLREKAQKGDIIFTVGAGDIYKFKDDIIRVMGEL